MDVEGAPVVLRVREKGETAARDEARMMGKMALVEGAGSYGASMVSAAYSGELRATASSLHKTRGKRVTEVREDARRVVEETEVR